MRRRAFLGLLGGLAATPVAARLPELPAPAELEIASRTLTGPFTLNTVSGSEIISGTLSAPILSVPNTLNGPPTILEDLPHEPSPSSR